MSEIKLSGLDKNGEEKEFSISDYKGKKVILYFMVLKKEKFLKKVILFIH